MKVVLITFIHFSSAFCAVIPGSLHWTNDHKLQSNMDERGIGIEGDMMFSPSLLSGVIDTRKRWPSGVVAYKIDQSFSEPQISVIIGGMQDISSKTCITFKERTTESDYVYIQRTQSGGCNSYVGRIGGKQNLNLQASGCVSKGIGSHELIHSLGFRHEHSRTDRDDYIDIRWANIKPDTVSAFNKYGSDVVSNFGVGYDYGSIMHYSSFAFALNSQLPTIIPKKSGVTIGQRRAISVSDAKKINNMYNCPT